MSKRPLTSEEIAIADRIRAIIADPAMELTEESVGVAVGAKQAQVSHWTGAREPVPVKRAKALARILRITDPGEVCVAYRDIVGPSSGDAADWIPIHATTQRLGLGSSAAIEEYAEAYKLKFRTQSLRKKGLDAARCEVAYGKGDSMLPRIRNGDAILFNRAQTAPDDGKLFVIEIDGVTGQMEPQVKRCLILGGNVYFEALNPDGDHTWRKARPMDDKRHTIKILGRVRWIGSWED